MQPILENVGRDKRRNDAEHVFISYVREDAIRVDQLQERLSAAGITVWRDTFDLRPGQDWKTEIRRAIEGGMAFIACFSEYTENRGASFQNNELIWAVKELRRRPQDRVWLVPVRFNECELPSFDLGADRTLNSLQWVDLFDGASWEREMAQLVESVRRVQARPRLRVRPPEKRPGAVADSPHTNRLIGPQSSAPGADLEADVTISVTEMVRGGIVAVYLQADGQCPICTGTGAAAGTQPQLCRRCNGAGQTSTSFDELLNQFFGTSSSRGGAEPHGSAKPFGSGSSTIKEKCGACLGRGLVIHSPCPGCTGDGRARRAVQIRIPAGVRNGQRLRVPGKGLPGGRGQRPGDLYATVRVLP